MMKVLQKLLLLAALTVGFSLTAMAQKQDPKKDTPPKPRDTPKIKIEPKRPEKPNEDKRNNDNKKPELVVLRVSEEDEIE